MGCNTPAQDAIPLHGLKPHPRAGFSPAVSSANRSPPSKGRRVPWLPRGWREPGWVERSPRSVPVPIPSARQGNWCLGGGRALLASLRSRPCSSGRGRAWQRRCRGGGGGNRTSPTVVAARRHFCPQPCHLPWVPATHPHRSAQFGQSFPVEGSAAIRQSSPRLQPQSGGKVP